MRSDRALLTVCLAVLAAGVLISAQPAPTHLDRALAAQRALVEQSPGDAGALNDLGNLLELSGDRRGAEETYLRAIELAPEEPSTRFNYGLLLLGTGRRRPALSQFRKVVELDPGHAWAHYETGAIWDAWGLDRWARRSYARAFELEPQLADPRVNPDVIDNREATAAMLLAWKRGTPAAAAPRDYSDPGRIASLLIEVPIRRAERTEEEGFDDEGGEESEGGFARITSPPLPPPARGDSKAEWDGDRVGALPDSEPRVLDASDLPPSRSLNQVSTPGGTSRSPSGKSGRNTTIRRPTYSTSFGSTGRLEPALRPADPEIEAIAG